MTKDAFEIFKQTPMIGQVEDAFSNTPYVLEWAPLPASEVPGRAAQGEFDGSIGNIQLGSPALSSLEQVPIVLFRQTLYPIVMSGNRCPRSLEELDAMRLHGIEHFVLFDAAETRLRKSIPRLATLPELLESLKTGETEVSVAFDYTLPGIKAGYGVDLELCKDVRIKSYQYYVYLHKKHAAKAGVISSALTQALGG